MPAPMLIAADPFGLPITVQREQSVAAVHGFVEGFLGYEPRILDVLSAAAHDDSLIVQCCAAALQMFSESAAGPAAARAHLQRAHRAGLPASERERRFATAVGHWVDGDTAAAIAVHEALAQQWPRDLASVKLGQYHAFNLGDAATMLRLAQRALHGAPEVPAVHGMLAFALEQSHRLDEAEAAARQSLSLRADEPWAQHALAHVMLTQGRFDEGERFMAQASGGWRRLTSFMRTHNWWHLALFRIEQGDAAAALRLYDDEVWGVDKSYSQDQIGAVSLLARLELVGVDVGARWQELAHWLGARVGDQVQPFLDMQYLYGLARAGRPEAAQLLARIEAYAGQAPAHARRAWQQVCVPACRGLAAHAAGRWEEAASQLGRALPELVSIGGSHAQRDLFEQICVDALERSGQAQAALRMLQPRLRAQPASQRLRARVARIEA